MGILILSIPYALAALMIAIGINHWAALGIGYVIFLFILQGFAGN